MNGKLATSLFGRFLKFYIVGGAGVFVDMFVLYLLAERFPFSLPLWSCKMLAALLAMASNFILNDRWTFRDCRADSEKAFFRFLRFVMICSAGLGIAIAMLYALNRGFGINLYLANAIAIFAASGWNFSVSSRFAWKVKHRAK